MRLPFFFLMIAGLLWLALATAGADAPPATQPATQPTFSIRGQIHAGASLDIQQIDLTRVVVYLESDPVLDAFPISAERPYIAQHDKAFFPKFLVIPIETVVEFPNWDHISHNVFSRSAAAPAFDLDRYGYGQSKSRRFEKVGVVQIFCNIHPYMRAIIFVTPNIFFARADKTGKFEIDGVPPGHYQITAWQERCAPQHQSVDVGPANSGDLTFTLDEDRDRILANDPPKRASYGVEQGLNVKRENLGLPVVTDVHPALTTEPSDWNN